MATSQSRSSRCLASILVGILAKFKWRKGHNIGRWTARSGIFLAVGYDRSGSGPDRPQLYAGPHSNLRFDCDVMEKLPPPAPTTGWVKPQMGSISQIYQIEDKGMLAPSGPNI